MRKMKKLLVVYNTCGLGGNSNAAYYLDSIKSLLYQSVVDEWGDDYKIAISGCAIHEGIKGAFAQFGDHITTNYIDYNYPLGITFNDTVKQCVKHFGEFEGYLYLDSGINFWDPSKRYDAVKIFYDAFKEHNDAVIAAMPSNDDGSSWWGIQYKPNEDYQFTIGQCTNLHCQIFPNDWLKAYNAILPDIFASNCSESVFSHLSSAIHKKYMMTHKINVLHLTNFDGASFGSRVSDDDRIPLSSMFQTPGLLYKTKRDIDEIYRDGYDFGFGCEEYQQWWRSDKTKFDSNQFAIDTRLKDFLAKELFLSQDKFNYNDIQRMFTAGK